MRSRRLDQLPAFYAHLVMKTECDKAAEYAVRVRGSDGTLQLQTEHTSDMGLARKWVEREWVNCLRYGCFNAFDELHEIIIERWRTLDEIELAAQHLTPADAQSPFWCIPDEQWRLFDPDRFPLGFPIIVEQRDEMRLLSDEAITRRVSGAFEYYRDYNTRIGESQSLVRHILIYQNLIREACNIIRDSGDEQLLDYLRIATTSKRIRISENDEYEAVIPPKRRYLSP